MAVGKTALLQALLLLKSFQMLLHCDVEIYFLLVAVVTGRCDGLTAVGGRASVLK